MRAALLRAAMNLVREWREYMKNVRVLVCAAGVCAWTAMALGSGFDAIGSGPGSTNGGNWLTSATNTDLGGDATTACGVGLIAVPAGERVTEIDAVIGTRGPGGGVSIDFANVSDWRVEFWSSQAAFVASPTIGDVRSLHYAAPSNADYATPYGTDATGRPTHLVRFRLPGGINPSQVSNSYFAIRIGASQSNVGAIGVLESAAAYDSGLWASQTLGAPGYIVFSSLPFPVRAHNGVFAYNIRTGCAADSNGDGAPTVQDIFDFLAAWFAGSPSADFNGTGGIGVQDIFDFLATWFAGC